MVEFVLNTPALHMEDLCFSPFSISSNTLEGHARRSLGNAFIWMNVMTLAGVAGDGERRGRIVGLFPWMENYVVKIRGSSKDEVDMTVNGLVVRLGGERRGDVLSTLISKMRAFEEDRNGSMDGETSMHFALESAIDYSRL